MAEFELLDDIPSWIDWDGEMLQHLKARRVYLEGDIGDAATSERHIDILADQPGDSIDLIISSNGGDISAGVAIIRAIQRAQLAGKRVRGVVRGMVASMALVILQACDERVAQFGDVLMAHGSTTGITGDSANLEEETKLLTYWHEFFASMYALRTKHDADYWKLLFRSNARNYYTAEEALEEGLIDHIWSNPSTLVS